MVDGDSPDAAFHAPRRSDDDDELSDLEHAHADAHHSLLNNDRVDRDGGKREYHVTPTGRLRAYWLGTIVCIGGFLCSSTQCSGRAETHVDSRQSAMTAA